MITTRNSPALARIKRTFNAKIYAGSRRVLNEGGMDALRVYLRQFFNDQCQAEADAIIDGPPAPAPEPVVYPEVDAYRAVAEALETHGWALVLESLQVSAEIKRLMAKGGPDAARFAAVRDALVVAREIL